MISNKINCNSITENKAEKFIDLSFPPSLSSLIGENKIFPKFWKEIKWLRPEKFLEEKKIEIFEGIIEPGDIKQGSLGDCYFLSTVGALAEWPHRIKKIFGLNSENYNYNFNNEIKQGFFKLTIYNMGEKTEVIIDDFFPCYKGSPVFSRSHGPEIWVLLLEKAWAKM